MYVFIDAILNSESQCGVSNRNCNGTDICVQAQVNFEFVNQCERRKLANALPYFIM